MSDNDTSVPSSAPESSPPPASSEAGSLDLSTLKNLSFGPDWSSTPSSDVLVRKLGGRGMGKAGDSSRGRDSGGFGNGGPPRRDRRPARPSSEGGAGTAAPAGARPANFAPNGPGEGSRFPGRPQGGDSRPSFRDGPRREGGYGRDDRRHSPPPFRPTHDVLFYPDDAAFRALLKAIRTSCRTYELFEVAQLILQKPERFVVVIKPYPRPDGSPAMMYVSQPDHLPFESEDEAVGHVFDKHLAKFLTVEEIEVEPPKGNFVGVSKCGFTGELLGPPNYHKYPDLLREHHARKLSNMAFERFTSRIELVKEPEQIAAWLEKMKKATRYKLVTPVEGAPEFFESLDSAKAFLLNKNKDVIVRAMDTTRYPGRLLEQFPQGNIRHSVEAVLQMQRRFPLETANNLRGRLRRMKFNLYKKGSKGVSYVCAVKRRFRDPQTVLADHVQKLITFIEQHPQIPALRLPHEYLGLPLPATESKAKEPAAPVAETPAPAAEATVATPATDAPVAESVAPVAAEKPAAPATPTSNYTPEQQLQLRELVISLRWLVTEGYVVEYGDGKLFASPPLANAKAKAAAESEGAVAEDEIVEDTEESPAAAAEAEATPLSGVEAAPAEPSGELPPAPPAETA